MTEVELAALVKALAPIVRDAVMAAQAPLREANKALELRLLELETRPAILGPPGPTGAAGATGAPGEPGAKGLDGLTGAQGRDGKDGTGVADAVLDRLGHLVLTFSDGRTKNVGLVTGRDADTFESRIAALEALELDPLEIEATFSGLVRKELDLLDTASPRPTVKRIEKSGTGYTVMETTT